MKKHVITSVTLALFAVLPVFAQENNIQPPMPQMPQRPMQDGRMQYQPQRPMVGSSTPGQMPARPGVNIPNMEHNNPRPIPGNAYGVKMGTSSRPDIFIPGPNGRPFASSAMWGTSTGERPLPCPPVPFMQATGTKMGTSTMKPPMRPCGGIGDYGSSTRMEYRADIMEQRRLAMEQWKNATNTADKKILMIEGRENVKALMVERNAKLDILRTERKETKLQGYQASVDMVLGNLARHADAQAALIEKLESHLTTGEQGGVDVSSPQAKLDEAKEALVAVKEIIDTIDANIDVVTASSTIAITAKNTRESIEDIKKLLIENKDLINEALKEARELRAIPTSTSTTQ